MTTNIIENIKNLREATGVGFLDCKKALEENNNDINKSIDYLRKKGLAKASKKLSRTANDGAVGLFFLDKKTLLIEINTETDFAAKSDLFLDFVELISKYALQLNIEGNIEIEEFKNKEFDGKKISDHFTDIISKIGENIVLKRLKLFLDDSHTKVFGYTHNSYRKNIGKICSVLKAEINDLNDDTIKFGQNLCMQIAALKPVSIDVENLDKALIEKEKEIQTENIKSSGKPDNIIPKILEGKMKKFYSEVTLLNQNFILDDEKTVKKAIEEFSNKNGKFNILDYSLFILGS